MGKEAPYTYERMPSPQPGFHPAQGYSNAGGQQQQGVHMGNIPAGKQTAYEPYRQAV